MIFWIAKPAVSAPSEEAVPGPGQQRVHRVAKKARDEQQGAERLPGKRQVTEDAKDRLGARVHVVADDQGDAAQGVGPHPQPAQQSCGRRGLSGGKPKRVAGVAAENEIHPRAAEIAFPIEDDHPV